MSLDQILPSLQKEVAPFLSRIADEAGRVTTSNNVAKDYAVQVCGPVAGSIQYIFNFSLHYHAGEIDTCWRLSGGTGAFQDSTSERSPLPRTAQKFIEPSSGDPKLQDIQHLAVQALNTHLLHLHRPGKDVMPVLATFDPNTEGNWIASRIVKRLGFEHQQAKIHKEVPAFSGQSFERTRIFVDLTCGNQNRRHRCQHRFYVVNHCKDFDILLGTKLCP
ncbi:hypothetical protein F5882DRAFT_49452 [Hyaloscypha sp. PMI_1271]|nr:hypothetical protein F5882DRAFT_49452 [Hyaloscypha sp. PMI_1271]